MGWLKGLAEAALVRGGPARLAQSMHRRHALVLAYHNIVPDGEACAADRSLHLPRRDFARQLDLLTRTHDVVPLARLLTARDDDARARRPWASITFDDAYRGSLSAGLEETTRRGLPVTVFVPPAMLGGRVFWWDAYSSGGDAWQTFRAHALTALRGDDAAVRVWADETGFRKSAVPAHATSASLAELKGAVRAHGVTLGAHGWSHRNLASLAADEVRMEMERPLKWLREQFAPDVVVPCIAYPYGIASRAVQAASGAAGYAAAMRVDGGLARLPLRDRYATPRVNVPAGLSDHGLALRCSGLL